MIRIGIRNNLFYPFMLVLFIVLRRVVQEIIKEDFKNKLDPYFLPFLIFLSEFIFGLIAMRYTIYKKKTTNASTIMGITLIEPREINVQIDDQKTILLLIIISSYFNFAGTMARKFYNLKIENSLENRLKCFHILIAAVLCYYTIKINIYKHNICSMILIFFFSIIIIFTEIIMPNHSLDSKLKDLGLTLFSGFSRAFLDTIEKHLFEFDYLNPFKILMLEGIICCVFSLLLYLYRRVFKNDFSFFLNNNDENTNIMDIIFLIFLLILYFILSGFKNIYIMITIKIYSPMTRGLTETIIDPLYFLYFFLKQINRNIKISYYIINFACLIIIVFCSLIYNDFIILYCCGLEKNTYREIKKRSITYDVNDMLEDNESDYNTENDDDIRELNDKEK